MDSGQTSSCCGNPSSNSIDGIHQQHSIGAGDSDVLDQKGQIVRRDVVSRKLTKPGHSDCKHQSITGGSFPDKRAEIEIIARRMDTALPQRFSDFVKLDIDDGVVGLSVRMVLDNKCSSLGFAAPGYQPARAFRDEIASNDDEARAQYLQPQGKSPLEVAMQIKVASINRYIESVR